MEILQKVLQGLKRGEEPNYQEIIEDGLDQEEQGKQVLTKDDLSNAIWAVENSLKDTPNKYTFTQDGLEQAKAVDLSLKDITLEDIKKNKDIENKAFIANVQYLTKYILDDKHRTLKDYVQAWYLPFGYKESGYDLGNIKDEKHKNIMENRLKNLQTFFPEWNPEQKVLIDFPEKQQQSNDHQQPQKSKSALKSLDSGQQQKSKSRSGNGELPFSNWDRNTPQVLEKAIDRELQKK